MLPHSSTTSHIIQTSARGPEGSTRYLVTAIDWWGGCVCQYLTPATLPWERDPAPIVQETGWAPGPVWIGAENLASAGIRSPDRPAYSQSLYRLNYPWPTENKIQY